MSDETTNTADSALPARPSLAAAPAAGSIEDGHARRLMDALADNRPLTDAERAMLLGLVMQRDQADAGLLQIITDLRARLAAAAPAVGAAPADASPADDADVLRKLAQRAALEAVVNRACDGSTLAQKSACLEWLASDAEYQRMLTGGRRGGDLMAAEKALAKQMAYLAPPQPPDQLDDLRAQFDGLRAQLADLRAKFYETLYSSWPAWATEILKTVREFSGYDGFDDSTEGIDLPGEVRECLQELGSQVERLRAQCRALAPVAGTGPAKQWLWRVFNQGRPPGHEDSTNEWGAWSLISAEDANRLASEDDNGVYEFVPYVPATPPEPPCTARDDHILKGSAAAMGAVASSAPAASACPECHQPTQWRCAACGIASSKEASDALRAPAAPAEAVTVGAEPVAWCDPITLENLKRGGIGTLTGRKVTRFTKPLYAAPVVGAAPTAEQSAAVLLAEQVLHMDLVTERGVRARELARQVLDKSPCAEDTEAEAVLRMLASYLGAGGFNAPAVDAKVFHEKIMWGIKQIEERAALAAPPVGAGGDAVDAVPWPKARDVGRLGDMSPPGDTHLRVLFDNDNDVIVEVFEADRFRRNGDLSPSCAVEFCNGGGGGGKSLRTRTALIALMVAMEQDNAESAHKAWPATRAARDRAGEGE